MLQNAYFLAKISADTVENEQHFAEILPIREEASCVADCAAMLLPAVQVVKDHNFDIVVGTPGRVGSVQPAPALCEAVPAWYVCENQK